jgi:uncharacterized peroxidase-related enzyme
MTNVFVPPSIETAPEAARPHLEAVRARLGAVPNMFRLLSNSPAALEAYLGFHGALAKGALDHKTRERIALAIAQLNGCDYCLSAHTFAGKNLAKLDEPELRANRNGTSNDPRAEVAVRFAIKLARERGHVDETDADALRRAGYGDAEILEIIAHVALNTFTNYLNEALNTAIDFPVVRAGAI